MPRQWSHAVCALGAPNVKAGPDDVSHCLPIPNLFLGGHSGGSLADSGDFWGHPIDRRLDGRRRAGVRVQEEAVPSLICKMPGPHP